MTPLLLALALLSPQQEVRANPAPDQKVVRMYDISEHMNTSRIEELEAIMADSKSTETVKLLAFEAYTREASMSGIEYRAKGVLEMLQFLLDTQETLSEASMMMSPDGRTLAVAAAEREHDVIEEALHQQALDQRQVLVEAIVFGVTASELTGLARGKDAQMLDAASLQTLRTDLDELGAETITAPKMITRPARTESLQVGNEVAYVADFEVSSPADFDGTIVDPVIRTVFDGQALDVCVAPLGDALRMRVEFRASSLKRPIATQKVRIGVESEELELQLPKVTTMTAKAVFDIVKGGAVVLAGLDPRAEQGDDGAGLIVVIEARMVDAPK